MELKKWNNFKLIIYGALVLLAFWLIAIHSPHDQKDSKSQGEIKKEELMAEFSLIHPMPGATRHDFYSNNKDKQALVDARYKSNATYSEIRSFYFNEAPKNGWTFEKEETIRDWGNDLGGKSIHFRKGEYTLSIQYAGKKADYGWDFAVSLSWGPH